MNRVYLKSSLTSLDIPFYFGGHSYIVKNREVGATLNLTVNGQMRRILIDLDRQLRFTNLRDFTFKQLRDIFGLSVFSERRFDLFWVPQPSIRDVWGSISNRLCDELS